METTIADLQHQLGRAQRARGARLDGPSGLGAIAAMGDGGLGGGGGGGCSEGSTTFVMLGGGGGGGGGSRSFDEMASRLANAERERDSTEAQRRSLTMQLRSVTEAQNAERSQASARAEQMQRQQRRLEDELGSLRQVRPPWRGVALTQA